MAKLLHIETSPRKDRSTSIAVANEFLEAYQKSHPGDEIETWDLWETVLPEFDGDTINAKYQILHGLEHTPEQAAAWQTVTDVFRRFSAADKYLFSLPMWNFGIPYKLKHFIDVITQPGLAFNYTPDTGYTGLVTGRPAIVVYARGGAYSTGDQARALDFQKPYMDLLLGFIGFTDIRSIVADPTLAAPDQVDTAKRTATSDARKIAETY